MSVLLDKLLTREQRESCAKHDRPSGVMPLDVSRFPDSCAFEGATETVSYDVGRIQSESERDPWLWRLIPAAIAAGAILTAWFEVVA